MKRTGICISIFILLFLTFAGALQAQPNNPKLDNLLQGKIAKAAPLETVRVIVQGGDPSTLSAKAQALGGVVLRRFNYLKAITVKMPLNVVTALAQNPNVTHISIDEVVRHMSIDGSEEAPNSSSGGLVALNQSGAGGQGVGVAIVDSGIAPHPDLNNVVFTKDFTPANSPFRTDPLGHGTHVAGIAAGSGQSSGGKYAGIAPQARLVNLRVLDATGGGYTSDVIAAIEWAIANSNATGTDGLRLNIRVINLSLGHQPYESSATDPLSIACRTAVKAGMVVVAAAGNYGKGSNGHTVYGGITTPGIEPAVITVGAVTTWGTPSRSDDTVASYSSRGPTIDHILKPDVTAPGSRIISTMSPGNLFVTNYPQTQIDNNYMKLSGTSMATPIVAGAAAMMLSANPDLTPNMVKAILMYTSEKRGGLLDWGVGYVNIAGAMDLSANINAKASVGQYWLKQPNLPYSENINGYTAVWGKTITWGEGGYAGNSLNFNKLAWSQTIVWGETITWEETIVWGETIVWETSVAAESGSINGQTITWDDLLAQSIVWDE